MAFRFSLEAVLRIRESAEHSEEAALLGIVRDITAAEQELHRVDAEQVRIRGQREKDLSLKMPAVHLRDIATREMELKTLADQLHLRLRQLETRRLAQLAIYQTARQDRQVFSELREQQHRAYQADQKRREQRTLDDLFLSRTRVRN